MWFVVFRAQVAMNSQALLRYHQHKMYTYADVFLFQYSKNEGGLGPNGMTSVYLVCDGGKTNQNGRCNANCIVRAEDMMTDLVGSFVDYLFYIVHVKETHSQTPLRTVMPSTMLSYFQRHHIMLTAHVAGNCIVSWTCNSLRRCM